MADGVEPTETDLKIARNGLLMQMKASVKCEDVEQFIIDTGLTDFVENEIKVKACNMAMLRMQSNVINNRSLK